MIAMMRTVRLLPVVPVVPVVPFLLFLAACNSTQTSAPAAALSEADNTACLEISLTGTMGGPANFGSLAGSGTLVKCCTNANNCGDVHLQFDTGRATSVRLA